MKLPAGLKQCQKLPEPIFTPATKAEIGTHDENISFEQSANIIGQANARYLRDKSIEIFQKASSFAESKGLILADTKFEWGSRFDCGFRVDDCRLMTFLVWEELQFGLRGSGLRINTRLAETRRVSISNLYAIISRA